MMNKTLIIGTIALVLIAVAIAWYWFAPAQFPEPELPMDPVTEMRYRRATASRWEWYQSRYANLGPVSGIVVDEDGNPVVGAEVSYSVQEFSYETLPEFNLLTGTDGRFKTDKKVGPFLMLRVNHQNYHKIGNLHPIIYPRESLYVEPDRYHFFTDEEVRIVLRKKLPLEPLFVRLRERYELGDDRLVAIPIDQAGAKVLNVSLKRSLPSEGSYTFDWEMRIRPVNGGIQGKPDPYLYLAPADGYQPEMIVSKLANDSNWSTGVEGFYFVRFSDESFARICVKPSMDGQGIYCESWYNPAKSRNLEYGLKIE